MSMNFTFRSDNDADISTSDSDNLVEVATKIKQLRDAAAQSSRQHGLAINEINNDPHLNDQGRTDRIAELEEARTIQRRHSIATENEIIDNKITELERRLDGHVGYSESNIIAFRDAQDRAEAVTDADRAAKLMERAVRSNDRTLAHALFRKAVDNRWTEAVRTFTTDNPSVASLVTDVTKLRNLRNQFGRAIPYM